MRLISLDSQCLPDTGRLIDDCLICRLSSLFIVGSVKSHLEPKPKITEFDFIRFHHMCVAGCREYLAFVDEKSL